MPAYSRGVVGRPATEPVHNINVSRSVSVRGDDGFAFPSVMRSGSSRRATPSVWRTGQAVVDVVSITQALLVAEHLSFRRAASVLGIRQSAVSRRVRSLEDQLGVSLFERHHGGVWITAAGVRFFERVRYAIAQLDQAVESAGAAGRGQNGHLRIGIFSSIANGFLRELLRTFRAEHPDVILKISEIESREYIELIQKRRLDVVFVMGAVAVSNFETLQLWTERIFAILPRGHALCAQTEVEWEALRDENFILRQSDPGPTIQDYVIKSLAYPGHRPSVQKYDVGRETSVHLVALGLGVSLTTEATTASSYPGVAFRPIADVGSVIPFSGVWSPDNDNPAFRRFLSFARVLSKKWNDRSEEVRTSAPEASAGENLTDQTLVCRGAIVQRRGLLP